MIIRTLTILIIMANAATGFLVAAGVVDVYGIEPESGVDQEVNETNENAKEIEDDQSVIESVVGTAITAVNSLQNLLAVPFAAPILALNLGVPSFIVSFVFAPLYIAAAIDVLSVIRGIEIR